MITVKKWLATVLLGAVLLRSDWSIAREAADPEPRIRLAVLPLENITEDTRSAHWRLLATEMLRSQLREIKSVQVLSDSSLKFVYPELESRSHQALAADEVQKVGLFTEARRAIWGGYQREGEKWRLNVQVMNVVTGETSEALSASSEDWFQVVSEIRKRILDELNIIPTQEEDRRMSCKFTSSSLALELMSRAYAYSREGYSLSGIEKLLRQALVLDPQFAMAQQALAHVLMLQNELDQARQIAKRAVKLRPDWPATHSTLGSIFQAEGLCNLARDEFVQAVRLDPDNPDNYIRLADGYAAQEKWAETVGALTKAEELSPYDPRVHAELGRAFAHLGQRDKALGQLAAAERASSEDLGVEQMLAEGYRLLNEPPKAVEYYERCLASANKIGLKTPLIEDIKLKLTELNLRLTPHFIAATIPHTFASGELEGLTERRLTPKERASLTNPFSATPEMRKWALELVGNATNEIDKAKRIFDGMTRRINLRYESVGRTAVGVFKDWADQKAALSCQDYTFLYIALAREVGVKAYYVLVDKDYSAKPVYHACVGVFVDDKALLIDPSYAWFGVPHKVYEFEDDLRVVAFFLSQSQNVEKEKTALRLASDWARLHFAVVINRVHRGEWKDSRVTLEAGLKLDSKGWWSLYAQAMVEWAENNSDAVVTHLRQCLQIDPDYPQVHYVLGTALASQGKLMEARKEYRTYLQGQTELRYAAKAREAIAYINERLPDLFEGKAPNEW